MTRPANLHRTVEVERKLEVGPAFVLPDLAALAGPQGTVRPHVHRLEATYLDTEDLRLTGARITLRRRTGGDDAGWHLKRPLPGGAREELHHPLTEPGPVPEPLLAQVDQHLRGARVRPVALLSTLRTEHRLVDARGTTLLKIDDDEITATRLRPGREPDISRWRELEVERDGGDDQLLADAVTRLIAAGARPSDLPSKLVRALGDWRPVTT
jgi:inorganic triphosphatase YgiF